MKATTASPRAGHRHTNGHEHDFEPVRGLPEMLPAGEHILWQGAPDWRVLAVRAFHVRKLAVYFSLLLVLQVAVALNDGAGLGAAAVSLIWPASLALLALGALSLLAYLSASTTAYTITNKRVVMRVGIVLTLAFNLPYSRVVAAGMKAGTKGVGDIALTLAEGDRIAWLNLWPHARPWQVARPQPTLRCVPDALAVAQLLSRSWAEATGRTLPGTATDLFSRKAPSSAEGLSVQTALSPR